MLPRLPAPTAAAPSGPAMMVSTTPIAIQPSSARARGVASAIMGRNSRRRAPAAPAGARGRGSGAGELGRLRRVPSRFGMRLIIDGHQIGQRDLRVFLGGGEARVSEQLLNGAEVGAVGQQMGGVGVAETV